MATGMILDKLKVKKLKEQGCVVTAEIEVPVGLVQDSLHNVWLRIQSQARLPGFRQGKAPLSLVQQQFQGEARERAVHELIQKSVPDAVNQLGLKPVASPEVRDLKWEPGKPLTFQIDVEQAPKVELKTYKKLKAVRKKYAATDEEVDKRVSELREGNARLDRAAEEAVGPQHYVVIDFEAFADGGKPLPRGKGADELVDMSSPQTVEGLTQGLVGMRRGETKDVPVTLEGGKKASFRATVKEIKSKVLPSLDDEFAKDVGFESLAELKTKIRELIEKEGESRSSRELSAQLEDALLSHHKFDAPPSLVASQLERLTQRVQEQMVGPNRELPEEEYKKLQEKLVPRAEAEVRLSFLLRAIAAAEKLEAAPQDLEAELAGALAEAPNEDKKRGIRKFFEEHADEIKGMIRDRKTLKLIHDCAAITEG